MSGPGTAASSGAALGAVVVFLAQQLGYLSLSSLWTGVLALGIGIVVGGVAAGLVGLRLARRR